MIPFISIIVVVSSADSAEHVGPERGDLLRRTSRARR